MIYSIPYVILVIFLGIIAVLLYQRKEDRDFCHKITVFGVLVFFSFFAFRGFIFTDWMTYYPEFEECSFDQLTNYELGKSREPGYLIFLLICKSIFNNYHFFVFTCTLVNTILLLSFFKKYTDNIFLALIVYLVFDGFVISINLLRNSISIFIFLNSLDYLKNRKPLQYFSMCLLALSFHYTAILYFPLYFFFYRKLNKWLYLGIFILCNVIFILHIPIFLKLISLIGIGGDFVENKLEYYTEVGNGLGFGLGYIERLIIGGLVFCYYDRLNEIREDNKIFINALVAYFIAIFMFSEFTEISNRIRMLFVFSYWILWEDLIKCFSIENNRKLFITFVSIYCILKTVGTINQPVQEYDNLLLGNIKSYQERKYIFEKTFEEPTY